MEAAYGKTTCSRMNHAWNPAGCRAEQATTPAQGSGSGSRRRPRFFLTAASSLPSAAGEAAAAAAVACGVAGADPDLRSLGSAGGAARGPPLLRLPLRPAAAAGGAAASATSPSGVAAAAELAASLRRLPMVLGEIAAKLQGLSKALPPALDTSQDNKPMKWGHDFGFGSPKLFLAHAPSCGALHGLAEAKSSSACQNSLPNISLESTC